MGLGNVVRVGTNVTAFLGVLIALPLSLDIGGESCMLTLSMLVVVFYWAYSTIHLFTRNSPLRIRGIASVFSLLACFQPLVIAALLLFTLSIHSPQSTLLQSRQTLDQLAQIWRTILLKSSPLFFIAEAIASLIVVQAISRYSSRSIAVSSVPDLLQLLWLIVAAAVYVTSSNFLYQAYESTTDPSTATLLAISVTSVVFLSGISFSIRKGNIVETSGVFAYVVFQVWNLNGGEGRAGLGIYQFIQTKNGHPALPPAVIRSFDAIVSQFSAAIDFVRAASSALPLPVLVGLFYRVIVLYSASTIILALKREKEGYLRQKLSEEDPASKFVTILSTYSRLMLISVYTHLLLLNNSENPHFWRWISVFLTIGLWGVELKIGTDDARWKTD